MLPVTVHCFSCNTWHEDAITWTHFPHHWSLRMPHKWPTIRSFCFWCHEVPWGSLTTCAHHKHTHSFVVLCFVLSYQHSVDSCHFYRYPFGVLHYDDVIKRKHFPRNWLFVRGIHRSPVNSPHKGQWRGALMFSLIFAWINGWVNNREAGDLRRYRAHWDVIVM